MRSYRRNKSGKNKGSYDRRCGNIGCKKRRQYSYSEKWKALQIWDMFKADPTVNNTREMAKKESKIQNADLLSKWQKQREHIKKMVRFKMLSLSRVQIHASRFIGHLYRPACLLYPSANQPFYLCFLCFSVSPPPLHLFLNA